MVELLFKCGSRNKIAFSKFRNLESFAYLTYKFLLRKVKPWVMWRKSTVEQIRRHFFLAIRGQKKVLHTHCIANFEILRMLPYNSWLRKVKPLLAKIHRRTNLMATCFCNPGLRKSSAHSKFRNSKFDILAKKG
jgi:hypothetical protein